MCLMNGLSLPLQAFERVLSELIGEFALHLVDFTGTGVVTQGPSHFLVGHGLAVTLAAPPHLSKALLIL